MDRTRLPAKGRCQGSAWSTLDVRQANSALGVLTICAKFGSTVLIVKPSIIKCFKVGIVAFTHRAIERSVESCTRCADAEQLLDGCCSRLNSGWSLLSEISVVVRPPHKSRNNKWPRKQRRRLSCVANTPRPM